MKNIIYNRNVIAIPAREGGDAGSVPTTNPFELFGTEYGLFLPITLSGYQFLRWLRRGRKDKVAKNAIACYMLHVSNDGEVMTVYADSEVDHIMPVPYHSEKFTLMNVERDVMEAYTYLMRDCKTIAEAVKFVEEHEIAGMYEPTIILVEDWVAYAKEKGYTQILLDTHFN